VDDRVDRARPPENDLEADAIAVDELNFDGAWGLRLSART
jgi:hypothetical protein